MPEVVCPAVRCTSTPQSGLYGAPIPPAPSEKVSDPLLASAVHSIVPLGATATVPPPRTSWYITVFDMFELVHEIINFSPKPAVSLLEFIEHEGTGPVAAAM